MNQSIKATIFIALTIIFGALAQGCTNSKVEQSDLEGFWVLKSINGIPVNEAFKGNKPSIEFDFDKHTIYGSSGCNRYFGPFTLEENTFKAGNLASTNMLCLEENQEHEFLAILAPEQGLKLAIENGILLFKNNDKTVLEFELGENPTEELVQSAIVISLADLKGKWTLNKIKGESTDKLFGEKSVTLIFAEDGSANGHAGCNNYHTSSTKLNSDTLSFGNIISTQMACPHLEGESIFTQILSKPTQVTLEENILKLSQDNETVLEFILSEE